MDHNFVDQMVDEEELRDILCFIFTKLLLCFPLVVHKIKRCCKCYIGLRGGVLKSVTDEKVT